MGLTIVRAPSSIVTTTPKTAKLTPGILLHASKIARFHELAVRVEFCKHTAKGTIGQVAIGNLSVIDIVLANELHRSSKT